MESQKDPADESREDLRKPLIILVFLLLIDLLILLVFAFFTHSIRPDFTVILLFISLCVYFLLARRKNEIFYLIFSSLISFVWVFFTNDLYNYNRATIKIFGLNSYLMVAWAVGLTFVYLLFSYFEVLVYRANSFLNRFIIFSFVYFFLIVALESFAYHFFDIRNLAAAIYPGLPICDCIHGPWWVKTFYFVIGPFYFLLCEIYKLKRIK